MARKVVLQATARQDLRNLIVWITKASGRDVANAYVDRIIAACGTLADFPDRGTPRSDGRRSIVFERRATIVYRVEARRVMILAVAHRGRDPGM